MKGKKEPVLQGDLFKIRLSSILNLQHELCLLADEINWEWIDKELNEYYSHTGRPSVPTRTMVGVLLLKQMHKESDETVILRWVENPYWQYFTGETFFQYKPPFNPTDFVHFRKRVGEKGMEKILSLSVRLHCGSEVEEEVLVDTTVQEKNIAWPTDERLALKIMKYCWAYAEAESVELRQSYRRVVKNIRLQTHNANHPKRKKSAHKARKKIKLLAGRLVRDLKRKLSPEGLAAYGESLELFEAILAQKPQDKDKRYSLHEPDVWCIAKGKAHKKFEFGCKVSVTRTSKTGVIVGMKNFKGNPYDGDTLAPSLAQTERIRKDANGTRPAIAIADRGYRGRKNIGGTAIMTPGKSQKTMNNYQKGRQRARFRNRAGIEPVIGHLKYDFKMLRNYLSRSLGDAINCLLAGAAFNMKKRLNQLRTAFFGLIHMFLSAMRANIRQESLIFYVTKNYKPIFVTINHSNSHYKIL